MTLAEAVAASGGLLDLADPGSVFLFGREPRELAEKLGVECSKMDGRTVPIIFQSASSMFSISARAAAGRLAFTLSTVLSYARFSARRKSLTERGSLIGISK
jgi:hypothetical protein